MEDAGEAEVTEYEPEPESVGEEASEEAGVDESEDTKV